MVQETTRATLFIADKKLNSLMKAMDVCPDYKVFVTGKEDVSFKTKSLVNDGYWMNMIEKSKTQRDYWIPAVQHDGVMYVSPEIMEISDGNKNAFIGCRS